MKIYQETSAVIYNNISNKKFRFPLQQLNNANEKKNDVNGKLVDVKGKLYIYSYGRARVCRRRRTATKSAMK